MKPTRVPDPFPIDEDLRKWFQESIASGVPQRVVMAEHEAFMDYWRGVPGKHGTKADWRATWRNGMRRAANDHRSVLGAYLRQRGRRPVQEQAAEPEARTYGACGFCNAPLTQRFWATYGICAECAEEDGKREQALQAARESRERHAHQGGTSA